MLRRGVNVPLVKGKEERLDVTRTCAVVHRASHASSSLASEIVFILE